MKERESSGLRHASRLSLSTFLTGVWQAHNVDSSCLARAQRAVPLLRKILAMVVNGEEEGVASPQHLAARRVFQNLGLHHVVLRLLSHVQIDRAKAEAGLAYAVLPLHFSSQFRFINIWYIEVVLSQHSFAFQYIYEFVCVVHWIMMAGESQSIL